jgi:hypothetical protein
LGQRLLEVFFGPLVYFPYLLDLFLNFQFAIVINDALAIALIVGAFILCSLNASSAIAVKTLYSWGYEILNCTQLSFGGLFLIVIGLVSPSF